MTTEGTIINIKNGNSYLIQNYAKNGTRHKTLRIAANNNAKNEIEMETIIKNNKYLVSLEEDENDTTMKFKKKKEIISYTANRDTLFIPHLEKSKQQVDISDKIIENKLPISVSDLAIQSDPINYTNQEKPFVPQKIGKDIGVQIDDGDLFNFDNDVQPLLIVLCGKVLEQALQELHEEDEVKNLREMKQIYMKKFHEEKLRMKNIEKIEIKLKKDNDALKKLKMIEKITKINTQQKLFTRSFAKQYLTNLAKSSMEDLHKKAMFVDFNKAFLKNKLNEELFIDMEKQISFEKDLSILWQNIPTFLLSEYLSTHRNKLDENKRMLQIKREKEERDKKEEEGRKRIEEEETKERRRIRAIRRMRESIRKNIFGVAISKHDYHLEEISEIDNYEEEGPFSNIFIY